MVHPNIELLYCSEGQLLYTDTFIINMNTVADIHSMTGLAHGNAQYNEASAPVLSHKPLNQLTFKLSTLGISTTRSHLLCCICSARQTQIAT